MSVTLNILEYWLGKSYEIELHGDTTRSCIDFQQLSVNSDDPHLLYIVCAEDLMPVLLMQIPDNVCIACIGAPLVKDKRVRLVFNSKRRDVCIDLRRLYMDMQEVFMRFRAWERDMDHSLLRNEGIQALLDVSESMLEDHVDIVDPAMKLLAHTRMDFDDPITERLVRLGYHSEETLQQFKLDGRYRTWAETDGFVVNTEHKISRYSSILYSFKSRGTFSVLVVIICHKLEPCDYLFDVLKMFIERVGYFVETQYSSGMPISNALDAFFRGLFAGEAGTASQIEERCKYLDLVYERPYCVFYFGLENSLDIPTAQFANAVAQAAIPYIAVTDDAAEVVICSACKRLLKGSVCYPQICPPHAGRLLKAFRKLLVANNRWCGQSSVVENLSQIPAAYWQAKEVYELNARVAREQVTGSADNGERILRFDDEHIYLNLISQIRNNEEMFAAGPLKALGRIRRYDAENGSDYYEFLRCYLECERRTSHVAELLHMHRNNVIHRVRRIAELFGIECNDPQERLNILNAYKLRDTLNI